MDNSKTEDKEGVENMGFELHEDTQAKRSDDIESQSPERKRNPKILSFQAFLRAKAVYKAHSTLVRRIILSVILALFLAFLIAACVSNLQRALALPIMTCVAAFFISYDLLKRRLGKQIINFFTPVSSCLQKYSRWFKRIFALLALAGLIAWLAIDTAKRPEQLISFGGLCLLVFLLFIFSKSPLAVSGRSLFVGLGMQFALGLFIIRTEPGFQAFNWLGKQTQIFLNYTTAGSSFLFGNELIHGLFAFQALPIVVFFSCVMSVLYYVGVMQWLIIKIAWLMQVTMGTSATESLSVAGNIFVGQTEAPLLIRPYLAEMTKSEIHAVMTGGFATIAGSVLGAYISFGVNASSLIAASVMAAPCALALSKLSYPELEESKFMSEEGVKLDCGKEQNILEAASNGASASIGLIANIAVNLLAFLAILEFLNAALSWLGGMLDYPELSFQVICSYVFMPIAFMMGVDWDDSFLVAELIGVKLFLNEFVAYRKLSLYEQTRLSGVEEYINGQKQWISVICSYVFMPIAFMMGVDWDDSFLVAELIGVKLFLNEFVAYRKLSLYEQTRLSGVEEYINGQKQWISVICSYVFMPIAFMMGVDWDDSFLVAELIGVKLFLNEFVAYQKLSLYGQTRLSGVEEYINGQKQWISVRAETLTTYALCGFANFSSVGVMLGGLSAIAPMRKSDMAQIVIHALFTGFLTSLVNACVAGILFVPRDLVDCVSYLNSSTFNETSADLLTCCKDLYSAVYQGNGTIPFIGDWSSVNQSVTFLNGCCGVYNNSACTV